MVPEQCPNCRLLLPTDNGFIFCSKCKVPQFLGDLRSPFQILGVPVTFNLNEQELETQYYALSKKLHPDRFSAVTSGTSGALAKVKSQELSAALNQSYNALRQPESRLETLLKTVGAIQESVRSGNQGPIPAELAEEFFELQELAMDNATDDPDKALNAIDQFGGRIKSKNEKLTATMFELASVIDWSKPDKEKLNKILDIRRERSYLRSMNENLENLKTKVEEMAQ